MKLVYDRPALRDLATITEYIARDNPDAAEKHRIRIEQSIIILRHHPHIGRETEFPGLYRWSIPGLAYAAYYRVEKDRVRILRVIHTRRNWPQSFSD